MHSLAIGNRPAKYDRLAAIYDRRWAGYVDATLRAVVDELKLSGQERILDVPCGTGELQRRLRQRWPGVRLVGVDLSRAMLTAARRKEPASAADWIQADAQSLPLASESFDRIVCASSFHYFSEPGAVLGEFRRLLKPEGRLIVVDWSDDYWCCKLLSAWSRWTDPHFHKTYTLAECAATLRASGLQPAAVRQFRVGWFWGLLCCTARRPGSI